MRWLKITVAITFCGICSKQRCSIAFIAQFTIATKTFAYPIQPNQIPEWPNVVPIHSCAALNRSWKLCVCWCGFLLFSFTIMIGNGHASHKFISHLVLPVFIVKIAIMLIHPPFDRCPEIRGRNSMKQAVECVQWMFCFSMISIRVVVSISYTEGLYYAHWSTHLHQP